MRRRRRLNNNHHHYGRPNHNGAPGAAVHGRSIGRAHGLVLLAAYAVYLVAVFSVPAAVTAMVDIP